MEIPTPSHNDPIFHKWSFLAANGCWTTLLSILFLAFILPMAHGQSVIRFDDAIGTWDVAHTYPQGNIQNPNFIGTTTRMFSFSGDTLINGNSWNRMYATPTAGAAPGPVLQGYARQVDEIVLFLAPSGEIDTLYNFALQVGDSMRYSGYDFDIWLSVTSIGQALIQGVEHKVFHFSEQVLTLEEFFSDTWIEGIGSIYGPLASRTPSDLSIHYSFPDSTRLTCYAQDGAVLWTHAAYPDCVVNVFLSYPEWTTELPKIHPNPVSSTFTVSGLGVGKHMLLMHDAIGRAVWHTTLMGTGATLHLPQLAPGHYHLTSTGPGGRIQRFPLIVE